MVTRDVRVYPDVEALSRAAADNLATALNAVLARSGSVSLVLSGGSTPRTLYRVLATAYGEAIRWDRVRVYWGDERYVPPDDPRSNYRMVREALLDYVSITAENVYPMPTDLPDPDAAALAYEQMLRRHFQGAWPRFDLILLGLGTDGHTASLFAGSPALDEPARWVTVARAPVEPSMRLTLTLPVINHAARVDFLVTGAEKAGVLGRVLRVAPDATEIPAARVRPVQGMVTWWIDEATAAGLGAVDMGSFSGRG